MTNKKTDYKKKVSYYFFTHFFFLDLHIKYKKKMKRFKVKIILQNDDIIKAKSVGINQDDAIEKILCNDVFKTFIADNKIKKIIVNEINFTELNTKNFILQKSKQKSDYYIVTDIKRNIVVTFKEGCFNDYQKTTILFNNNSEIDIATSLKEIAEFLYKNHKNIL